MPSSSSTPSLAVVASLRRMVAMSLSHIPPPTMGSTPVTLLLARSVTIAETDTPFSLVPTSSMGV